MHEMKRYPTDDEAKKLICEIGRRMYQKNFVAANDGNIIPPAMRDESFPAFPSCPVTTARFRLSRASESRLSIPLRLLLPAVRAASSRRDSYCRSGSPCASMSGCVTDSRLSYFL